MALSHFMRPSLRKGAYAALSSAAWQEIRVRSGRDDKGEGGASIDVGCRLRTADPSASLGMTKGRTALPWKVVAGKANSRSLHYATPDFLLTLMALVHFMRPSLRKGAHAALSSAAWQEIRVRSGRDDNFVWVQQNARGVSSARTDLQRCRPLAGTRSRSSLRSLGCLSGRARSRS
jgi:hypothetical protein